MFEDNYRASIGRMGHPVELCKLYRVANNPRVSAPGQGHPLPSRKLRADARETKRRPKAVNKATLSIPEPRRIRDREHVRYVAKQPCLVCGRMPCDAHHLRFAQPRALGRKVSDEFTVPLCRGHHREVHRCGDEAAWWAKDYNQTNRSGASALA
jgi:hypothetical protein